MILQENIDQVIEKVGSNVDLHILEFVQAEKEFSGYLLGEDFQLLIESEKETLLFVHLVLYNAIKLEGNETPFNPELFQELEDNNWALFNAIGKNWEEKLESIFKEYNEEDLLAFAEDMVNDDDISQLAKELIFITAKSYLEIKLP